MKHLLLVTLVCLMPFMAHASDPTAALAVSAVIDTKDQAPPGMVYANTAIRNISPVDQEIIIWTQQGWSWRSSSPRIMLGIEALKNAPLPYVLHPEQEYSGRIELIPADKQPVTFRLGYYPKTMRPISTTPGAPADGELVWSNAVTLDPESLR